MKIFTRKNSNLILVFVLSWAFLVGPATVLAGSGAVTTPLGVPELQGGYSNLQFETFSGVYNVTTFVGPDNSWEALKPLLRSVQHTIYVEIYGVNDRDILEELWAIKNRVPGVDMKILLGRSSLGYASPNDYVAYNLSQHLVVPTKWTHDQWRYTHAKFVMIDNETVIVQSGNWAKTSFPDRSLNEIGNREWSIAIHHPTVTQYYLDVFSLDWTQGTDYNIADGIGSNITATTSTSGAAVHPFNETGHYNEYMEITPIFSNDTSLQGIVDLIDSANETLEIQIPYFTHVGDNGSIDIIMNATIRAANRGVDVRVISEEANKDNDLMAEIFGEHGIPVVWFKETWFSALHNKGIIVDGKIVYLSSINFSETSVDENREAGVIIENQNVTEYYLDIFNYDWDRGEPGNRFIDVDYLPIPVPPNTPVQVNATFYAFDGVNQSILSYRLNNGAWANVTMTNLTGVSDVTWTGVIPAQLDQTVVDIKVYAEDGLGDWYHSITRNFIVGNGTTGPPPFDMTLFLIEVAVAAGAVGVTIFFILRSRGYLGGTAPSKKSKSRKKKK
ncbi:MAG: phospholipase D-like domain-containing protein [Candidatus Ranarchaeia archaeon]|jgi:phosphatidylserine/phosphatidylglycerophosphate/cardiolipin synthase-like enzyme